MNDNVATDKEIADWVRARFPHKYIVQPIIQGGLPVVYAQDHPGGVSYIRIRAEPVKLATIEDVLDIIKCAVSSCGERAIALRRHSTYALYGRCAKHAFSDDLYLKDPGDSQ